ncbi:uncharacterized protein BJ171DRAFT_427147 [Polychytrium aggregatum]|uniref:uncharacterized protein n=1 Tax=Polychytrium aggregatum TaxID=110093 RepID=UPI0022FF3CD3|nr:uncharacterized protein BJ171DRAFT_427147 [Polychytrium aggregatum]KAI9201871.1 hypothetical protein BJ171DRAFT_427147 [Polychytrium aggregatum]
MAWLHFGGLGVQQSDEEAFDYWYHVHVRSTDAVLKPISTFMVGWCCYLGRGTRQDSAEGFRLFGQSREQGLLLGGKWTMDWSWGSPLDELESLSAIATRFYRCCAVSSDGTNMLLDHLLAMCSLYGFGTTKDQPKAAAALQELATDGFAPSQIALGSCYHCGIGIEQDDHLAFAWFSRSADQLDFWGQLCLADCYSAGYGTEADPLKATELYQAASDQGNASAQTRLANRYYTGQGVDRDYAQAIRWYRRAAEQGNANAQNKLGNCYQNGIGVDRNFQMAMECYRRSAAQGNAAARRSLSMLRLWRTL